MKSGLLQLICLLLITALHVNGQVQDTKTETSTNKEGKTEVTTTTLSVDQSFTKIITVEVRTPGGRLNRKTIYKKDIQGNWISADTCYDPPDQYQKAEESYYDKDLKYIRSDVTTLHKNGKANVKTSDTRKVNPSNLDQIFYLNTEQFMKDLIEKIEKDFKTKIVQGKSPCEKDQTCSNRSEIFIGYSYLNADGEPENTSFPFGAHAAMTYMLTAQFGLVADASFHTKKENETRAIRAFLMGGLQYHLMREREKKTLVYLRLLAGLAMDKQKYSYGEGSSTSKANALAIAAGLGLSYPLNRMFLLTLMPDYILTFFNEETQGNIRVSAGIKINLGCKNK